MRLLLDTHAFLWFASGSNQLSATAHVAISEPLNEVYLSPASYWEMCLKIAKGKLVLQAGWTEWLPDMMAKQGVRWLPITPAHCEATLNLGPHHGDPFDRMLVAQASVDRLTIVTIDPLFHAYSVPILW
jgi:PIN domain nuclease of toxin-antitoxin system